MKKLLLTVEDSFTVSGRGLWVLPYVSFEIVEGKNVKSSQAISVRLIHKNGSEEETGAILDFTHFNPGGYHWICIFANSTKEQVPIGTEVWLLEDFDANEPGASATGST